MPKLIFSSDHLPPHLPNAARASAWLEGFREAHGAADIDPMPDVPFNGRIEAVPLDAIGITTVAGSFASLRRTKRGMVADGVDDLIFVFNQAAEPLQIVQRGRATVIEAGRATLFDAGSVALTEPSGPAFKTLLLSVRRAPFAAAVKNSDDLVLKPIEAASEPLRMLKIYADGLMARGGPNDPATVRLVGNHLLDLVALTLGTHRDTAEIAGRRGFRAGRLNAVLADINIGFSNPSFSIRLVARKQRVTERYLHDLLHETGRSFGERVLELRLQKTYRMLSHWQHSQRKITDIAFSSGFSDVSYFNRCFRARFGMPPSDARAAAMADAMDRR